MILKKKKIHKPLYKKFLQLRENVQNRKKLLKFKKQKWNWLIEIYKRKLKNYKKFKQQDQSKYLVTKHPSRAKSYKNRYKNSFIASKKLRLFYGGLSKKFTQKTINHILNKKSKNNSKTILIELFESRLDIVLYRSKFSPSIKNARQLIVHKKICVNKKIIKSKSYNLKPGDLITINPEYKNKIIHNIKQAEIWPISSKHLLINYRTMEILFGNVKNMNISTNFTFNLNLEKIIL